MNKTLQQAIMKISRLRNILKKNCIYILRKIKETTTSKETSVSAC